MKVSVSSANGRVRLRFTLDGDRKTFYPGYGDDKQGLALAENAARRMELDWHDGLFDLTLEKYKIKNRIQSSSTSTKSKPLPIEQKRQLTLVELWAKYIDQCEAAKDETDTHYRYVTSMICKYAGNCTWSDVNWFIKLKAELAASTWNQRRYFLKSCIAWGLESGIIVGKNPYSQLKSSKKPSESKVKPFSKEEIQLILKAIETNQFKPEKSTFTHSHYLPFVQFLFSTGVRTGEAIGLRWKHVDFGSNQIYICESLSKCNGRRIKTDTKTGNYGFVPMTQICREALIKLKPIHAKPEDLVFTGPKNKGYLNPDNFRNRVWKPVLAGLGIEYRYPYQTRHTLLSHIAKTGDLPLAARIARHKDLTVVHQTDVGLVE